jgi:molybdopterin converting factor small subunit
MIEIKVRLVSVFAKYMDGYPDGKVTIEDGATVRTLAEKLGLPMKLVRIIGINGTQVDLDAALTDGDDVFIFPPALGGG